MRASIRRSASTSAAAQSRSIVVVAGRMVRVRRQASTNLRTRSSFDCAWGASSRSCSTSSRAAPPENDRNPYRRRSSARCSCRVSDRARVVAELLPVEKELATDEVHDRWRNELARGQQPARVAEDAQLQREAQLVAGTPPHLDVLQVLVAQGVVAQQVRLALRKGKQGRSLPAGQNGSPCHALSLDVCGTLIGTRPTIAGPAARRPAGGRRGRDQPLPRPGLRPPRRPAGARQLLAGTPGRRRARRLEARPPRPQPRPSGQHSARTGRPAGWACGCSPARGRRSTPRPRPAASCSASSRRSPSSSGS